MEVVQVSSSLDLFCEALESIHAEGKNIVVFTGAGVSTLSGIKDFRSSDGAYSKPFHGRCVEDILSLDTFRHEPALFYAWAKEFCYCLDRFQPNIVHKMVAHLEEKSYSRGVMTQNIDVLHQAAGSKHVLEIHGSPSKHHCLKCRQSYSYEEIAPKVMASELPKCSCGGIIKPDIIFYGEQLNERVLSACVRESESCGLFIVLGSSLVVQPAASMPAIAHESGAKLCIVNAQSTPLDRYADFHFDDLKTFAEGIEAHLARREKSELSSVVQK